MPGWQTFATIVGGAAAALIGLLFVAVSIRLTVISRSIELRNRAAQTLALFSVVLFVSIVFALPRQSNLASGLEFGTLAVLAAVGLELLDRRAQRRKDRKRIAKILDIVSPNIVTCLLLAVGAVLMLFELPIGAYVVVVSTLAAISGGIVSAWLFLTRVTD